MHYKDVERNDLRRQFIQTERPAGNSTLFTVRNLSYNFMYILLKIMDKLRMFNLL